MLPGSNRGTSGCLTTAIFTVLRNDGWAHRPPRSVREGGGGGALHQRGRIISAAQVELRGLACHFVKNAVRHYTLRTSLCCHYHCFICRLYLGAAEPARRNMHFISGVGRGLWWSSISLSLFSWGIQCGRPFTHFQVALHWHFVQRGSMGAGGGGGGRLFGVRLEDLKPGDDNIKQIGVRAGQKRVRRECVWSGLLCVGAGGNAFVCA